MTHLRDDIMNYGLIIYAILIGHSDKEHPLKQRDIRQLLKEEYGYNDFYMTDIYYDGGK